MKNLLRVFIGFVLLCLAACSGEEPEKKATLAESQEKIAAEAVQAIKTPIDQAKLAKELTESHNEQVQKNLQQQ